MIDQRIEILVFGENVDIPMRVDFLHLTDVVREDQIRSIFATPTCLHQLDLVGILEKFPHQGDGESFVVLAQDEDHFDRLPCDAIQISLVNIFAIYENVVNTKRKNIAHARQKSTKLQ